MDSPSDLSPNAPPGGIEGYPADQFAAAAAAAAAKNEVREDSLIILNIFSSK